MMLPCQIHLAGGFEIDELIARLLRQIAAHPDHPGVVLVEHFEFFQARPKPGENFTILLEHYPVARLDVRLVEEAPGVALPTAHLAGAPEEYAHRVLIDRRAEADDAEVAAWAA